MAIGWRGGASDGNDTNTGCTVSVPAGTANGDFMVAVMYSENADTWTLPSGWADAGIAARDYYGHVWVRCATKIASSESGSWNFDHSSSWNTVTVGVFSIDSSYTAAIDVGPSHQAQTNISEIVLPSITTNVANTMIVGGCANYDGGNSDVASSGLAEGADLGGCSVNYVAQASAGASGTKTLDYAGAAGDGAGWILAIKQTAAGSTNNSINIGDAWKEIDFANSSINIGDTWKAIAGVSINIGDTWKTVYGSP